jgi:hypothetical protein
MKFTDSEGHIYANTFFTVATIAPQGQVHAGVLKI